MPIIGIDLGTTNSLVSIWKDGNCQLIPNSLGKFLTPSVVSIDENGNIIVGQVAKERIATHPNLTTSSFKRFMGKNKNITLGNHTFTPTELSSFVLKKLKEDAENFIGEKITDAIISVPAYFDDNGRHATKIAGQLAGLNVERVINEPSAAALAYHKNTETDTCFLVVDLGGGTLDVSVVDAFSNVIEIISVSGDNRLGGNDFNIAIANYFCKQNQINPKELSKETITQIISQAEQCKIALSNTEPVMMVSEINNKHCDIVLTNQKLIEISAPLLKRLEKVISRALLDAKDNINEIDNIILVGGSCNMPIISEYITHILGKKPLLNIDADKAVAIGVGIAAGIKERKADIKDTLLTDICPFTLGTNIVNRDDPENDFFSPIIERNSTLPISRCEQYCTAFNNQKYITIKIYQGDEMYCKDNIFLGEIDIAVPPAKAGQETVDVRFTYDINGILQVSVSCNSTGKTEEKVILSKNLNLTKKQLNEKLKELEKFKLLPREQDENKLIFEIGSRLYKQSTGFLRNQVHEHISYFSSLLQNGKKSKIHKYRKFLLDFFNQIDENINAEEDIIKMFRNNSLKKYYDEDEDENYDLFYDEGSDL